MSQAPEVENLQELIQEWARSKRPLDERKANIPVSDDIVIGARIRPLLQKEIDEGHFEGARLRPGFTQVIDVPQIVNTVRSGLQLKSAEFYVDRVFGPDAESADVYQALVKPLADLAWNGGIGTFFAYGQTGSGKTFTVSALEKIVAHEYFKEFTHKNIHASFIELGATLNAAYDLLNDRKPVSILEDSFGETRLVGAHEPRILNEIELIKLINRAAEWRKTGQTAKNEFSSRSHAICKITITDFRAPSAPDGILYLVDLAGSELVGDVAQHGAERMREGREINKSLSILKDCIRIRAQLGDVQGEDKNITAKKDYVPFRQSAITKVLKHVFDPTSSRACKTAVVSCVNPAYADIPASKNTLRYAEMLRVPAPKPPAMKYDENDPKTWSNEHVRDWITANCGTPKVNIDILAPYHTGPQLLRMPKREFIARCQGTEGVTEEQASVVLSTLWRMHISQQPIEPGNTSAVGDSAPFKERIRPGMVVKLRQIDENTPNLAMILSPATFGSQSAADEKSYTAAQVAPAMFRNAFTLNIWKQMTIKEEDIDSEVVLEYDEATRYYFLGL